MDISLERGAVHIRPFILETEICIGNTDPGFLPAFVTLGNLLSHFNPLFPLLKNGGTKTYLQGYQVV